MKLQLAKPEHIDTVRDIVVECVDDLLRQGIDQWDADYPTVDLLSRDIDDQTLYVIENDEEIVATVGLSETQEVEYQTVDWKLGGPVLVIHRLCVRPRSSGRGLGTSIMQLSEQWAKSRNYKSIRLDVYSGNPTAVRLYARLGYSTAGHVSFRGRTQPFICMEKCIS